jgi:dCTP deaminase
MGTLSDRDLVFAMRQRHLVIEPDIAAPIQPASIDLRLGPQLQTFPKGEVWFDPAKNAAVPMTLLLDFQTFPLQPGELVLGSTLESVGIDPQYEGIIDGKSSWARIGLVVHLTAGYIDPGWGCPKPRPLTLEIKNEGPLVIVLRPGIKICQLRIARMNSTPGRAYGHADLGSHYADSDGPVAGRFGPVPLGDKLGSASSS